MKITKGVKASMSLPAKPDVLTDEVMDIDETNKVEEAKQHIQSAIDTLVSDDSEDYSEQVADLAVIYFSL